MDEVICNSSNQDRAREKRALEPVDQKGPAMNGEARSNIEARLKRIGGPASWTWGVGSMALSMCAVLGSASCDKSDVTAVSGEGHEIIGGFAANDPVLDAIGSLVIHFDSGPFPPSGGEELCGATLIGSETVLTAKHCAQIVPLLISFGARLTFAVGPSSGVPKREVNIASLELAPGDVGGFVGVGHDVSVMHLESPITDLTPVDMAVPSDDQIGQPFAAIGYGVQDNSGANGTRRLGKQTLRSLRGRVFETLFGNFDNFLAWFEDGTVPPDSADGGAGSDGTGGTGTGGTGTGGDGTGGDGTGGASGTGGRPGRPGVDGGIIFPVPVTVEEIARQIYDTTVLDEGYEVVTGGAPGDAQPCFGDSGSSLIRRQDGKFVSFGVVSGGVGSRESICDLGTVYATFGAGVLEFLQAAKQWTDPCGDLDSRGTCDGNVATRCTNLVEGRRRIVTFDCGSLEMTCNTTGGQVSCDGNVFAPPPPPMGPPRGDPRAQVDQVFMHPATLAARHASSLGQP
jgi:Trypsin